MITAVREAYATLERVRYYKQNVMVMVDWTIPTNTRSLLVPIYTVFNMRIAINMIGEVPAGDWAAIYIRPGSHIDIPNIRITGTPKKGMFFRSVMHLHIGRLSSIWNQNQDWDSHRLQPLLCNRPRPIGSERRV